MEVIHIYGDLGLAQVRVAVLEQTPYSSAPCLWVMNLDGCAQADPTAVADFASDTPRLGHHFDGFGIWRLASPMIISKGSGSAVRTGGGRHNADPLMRPFRVVFDHPTIDGGVGPPNQLEGFAGLDILFRVSRNRSMLQSVKQLVVGFSCVCSGRRFEYFAFDLSLRGAGLGD